MFRSDALFYFRITNEDDIVIFINQDVLILDIPVNYPLVAQVTHGSDQLRENFMAQFLINNVVFLNEVKEI